MRYIYNTETSRYGGEVRVNKNQRILVRTTEKRRESLSDSESQLK